MKKEIHTLDFCSIKYNLLPGKELKRAPRHCMMSQKIMLGDEQKYLVVIDYYTPRSDRHGWWLTLRNPGYQRGVHPRRMIFIKDGLTTPHIDQVANALYSISVILRGEI